MHDIASQIGLSLLLVGSPCLVLLHIRGLSKGDKVISQCDVCYIMGRNGKSFLTAGRKGDKTITY